MEPLPETPLGWIHPPSLWISWFWCGNSQQVPPAPCASSAQPSDSSVELQGWYLMHSWKSKNLFLFKAFFSFIGAWLVKMEKAAHCHSLLHGQWKKVHKDFWLSVGWCKVFCRGCKTRFTVMSSGNDDIFSDLIFGCFNQTYFFVVFYNSRIYSEKLLFKYSVKIC